MFPGFLNAFQLSFGVIRWHGNSYEVLLCCPRGTSWCSLPTFQNILWIGCTAWLQVVPGQARGHIFRSEVPIEQTGAHKMINTRSQQGTAGCRLPLGITKPSAKQSSWKAWLERLPRKFMELDKLKASSVSMERPGKQIYMLAVLRYRHEEHIYYVISYW